MEAEAPDDYAILVDGRKQTCDYLRRKLRRQYTISTGPNGTQTLFAVSRLTDRLADAVGPYVRPMSSVQILRSSRVMVP